MSIFQTRDFLAGLAALALGVFVIIVSSGFGYGTPQRMGPGFFPLSLGVLLSVIGGVIVLGALRNREALPELNIRPFIVVPLSILVFALLVNRVGFAPAGIATVVLAGTAEPETPKLHLLLLALCLVPAIWLLFAVGLGVQVSFVDWNI